MYLPTPPFNYKELYLYSQKQWEVVPSGVSDYSLSYAVTQNAPIVVTSSGYETTRSVDPWAQVAGERKYNKVGYGYFTELPGGGVDTSEREFALHPDSSGRLIFNQMLDENVVVEYESGPSGYYIATGIDLNPMENQTDGGFIHLSSSKDPTTIHVASNRGDINANGSEYARITATLYDDNFDRVSGAGVIFLIADSILGTLQIEEGTVYSTDPSGYIVGVRAVTDGKGYARVIYLPNYGQSGEAVIGAAWEGNTSDVQNWTTVVQNFIVAYPFVLDSSLLDTWDYLT